MQKLTHEDVPIDFDPRWIQLLHRFKEQFGKKPELETILFLIGINEVGKVAEKYSKEEKQDLMHVAVCKLLSMSNYFKYAGIDDDGWPQWEPVKELPPMTNEEQEILLKKNIILYFEANKQL